MATRDVRVRLSAEGQQEVVSAFRRVQQEAAKSKQSAVDASAGFNQLKDAAHSLAAEVLGYEAAVKSLDIVKEAISSSIEFGASIGKLEEKTGVGAETLQVFAAAAKRTGVETETLNKGLGLFAKAMGDAELGGTKAARAVTALFGSVHALDGLNADQKLRKVTDALSKLEEGNKKAKITTDLFGRSGLELIPILNDLGDQGFDKLKGKLQDLGVLMDESAIKQAQRAEEQLGDLKLAAQGLALQFTEGLLPSLSNVTGALVSLAGGAKDGESAFKSFGRSVGEWAENMIFGFANASISLRKWLDELAAAKLLTDAFNPAEQIAHKIKTGEFLSLPEAWAGTKAAWAKARTDAEQEQLALIDAMNKGQEAANAAEESKGTGTAHEVESKAAIALRERVAKARLDLDRAQATEELQIETETNRLALDDEKRTFQQGGESVTAYYEHRRKLAKETADAVQTDLKEQIALQQKAFTATDDPAKRIEIEKTISELKTKERVETLKANDEQEKLRAEEVTEYNKLADARVTAEARVEEAQGKGHARELAAIDKEAEKFRTELLQLGEANIEAKVAEFESVLKAQANFKTAEHEAEQLLRTMEIERKNIELSASAGLISETDKKRQLMALERERTPVLQAQLKVMQDIAQKSGLPELIALTQEWGLKIREATLQTETAENKSRDLGKVLGQSIGKDLNNFFSRGIFQAKSFGDAMRGLGQSVVSSLNQMFTQLIMQMIRAKLQARLAGGGGGGGFLGFLGNLVGGMAKKAGGGPVHGPGTGTSDSVPIWASHGEYVVKTAAVQQPGVRQLLDAINFGMSTPPLARSRGPRFAQGGEVTSGGMVLGGEKNSSAALTVGLDYGLVIKSLEAHPAFGKVVVRHLSENRKAANSALGR